MKKFLVPILIAFATTSCMGQNEKNIVYDANAVARVAKNFHEVEVSGAIDLYLSQGNEEAVAVSGSSSEIAAKIKTEVKNGVLKIYFDNQGSGWKSWGNAKMKAYVTFKNLNRIEASGACNVKAPQTIKAADLKIEMSGASDFVGDIVASNLKLDASGASNMKVSGMASDVTIDASGASSIKGYELKTAMCKIDASGAASVRIRVNKELTAEASGGSCVYYKGDGVIKYMDASGGASIKKKAEGE
ncbi:head GIN domain-containing protein [Parasediminibacterium sp. JCM 36343]|uniref:head GIN domain-containing protein n=1 Tax=Parasediminibacterium sp. JCM 36343 TaxID=3374279 RepID=UPI00397A60E6